MSDKKGNTALEADYPLLLLIARGDENAFAQLVSKYRNQVFGHALMFVKSHETAEDLAQDIFVKIWLNKEKLMDLDSFPKYIFILSRNHLVSHLRKTNLQIAQIDDWIIPGEDEKSPEKQLLYKQLHEQVEKGIMQLKPQQKLAYQFCKEEGLTYKEAAIQMKVSPETVKWHLVAALNFLRIFIKNIAFSWIIYHLFFHFW